jgi:hypothetical protein
MASGLKAVDIPRLSIFIMAVLRFLSSGRLGFFCLSLVSFAKPLAFDRFSASNMRAVNASSDSALHPQQ